MYEYQWINLKKYNSNQKLSFSLMISYMKCGKMQNSTILFDGQKIQKTCMAKNNNTHGNTVTFSFIQKREKNLN